MSAPFFRKDLSAEGLLRTARRVFTQIPDVPGNEIALVDHLMSGLAVFGLMHPEHQELFPLVPEPILRADGAKKNDCEHNAAKRLLTDLRRGHPHLKLIVVEDGRNSGDSLLN